MAISSDPPTNGHSSNGHRNGANGHNTYNGHDTNDHTNGHANRSTTNNTDGSHDDAAPSSPIAIVGLSCKFGGDATNPHKLWQMVAEGKTCWSPFPQARFDAEKWYHPDKERMGRNHAKGGHFLSEDLGNFDAAFFNFAADIASASDPQVRLVLESVYEAVENAGIPMDKLSGTNTSVFSGVYTRDYNDTLMRDPEVLPPSLPIGTGAAMMSNRVSHFYDFRGASMTADTGCSSGLVVLHQAMSSLRNNESETAVVAASTVLLNPDMFISLSTHGMIGEDGKVYAWDDRANGYARGEGVAALVLKPLDAALRDNDNIRAVIRQTALNQDGKTTTITSPSVDAQELLIRDCYARAGLNMADTPYVEAHMTGTISGDTTEAEALGRTFGRSRESGKPVIVGGVKTNIGHTESVSGLAAVVKAVMMLENGLIPPNCNYKTPNPKIPLKDWNLKVPLELSEWPTDSLKRISVNNFGYGGTNAHVILDKAPARTARIEGTNGSVTEATSSHDSHLFVISAKDSIASAGMIKKLATYIREKIDNGRPLSTVDLAYHLSDRRALLPWVVALSAPSLPDLVEQLESPATKAVHAVISPSIGFVFNGQGAQWHAMGRELIAAYPVFRASIERAEEDLKDLGASWSLIEELNRSPEDTRVGEMHISQPISVGLQICLVDLLASWGIHPSTVTSHSSGEIAAAYAVGALSFKQALGVAFYRGELALQFRAKNDLDGAMLAASLGTEEAEKRIATITKGRVVVACVNSPESVTLSGDMDGIDEMEAKLKEEGIFGRKLKVPLAYHSHHMRHMAEAYQESLEKLLDTNERTWSGIPFYSPVVGGPLSSPKALGPSHWVKNLVSPVLFSQSFDGMCYDSAETTTPKLDFILEVGAHGTLSGPIRQIVKSRAGAAPLPYVSCLSRNKDAVQTMQELAAFVMGRGAPLKVSAVNVIDNDPKPQLVADLPTYAWNHTRKYWYESRLSKEIRYPISKPHQLLGMRALGSNGLTPTWRQFLRLGDLPWLQDHMLEGNAVLPGAGYVSLALEAARQLTDLSEKTITGYKLKDVDIINALNIPDDKVGLEVQLCLRPADEKHLDNKNWWEFELCSCSDSSNWTKHGRGYVSAETTPSVRPLAVPNLDAFFKQETTRDVSPEDVFASLREMNFYHGPQFQNLLDIKSAKDKAVTNMEIAPFITETDDYIIHPTTLDSIIVAAYNVADPEGTPNSTLVPRGIKDMYVSKDVARLGSEHLQAFSSLSSQNKRGFSSSAIICSPSAKQASIVIEGLQYQAIPHASDDHEGSKEPVMLFKNGWELDITRGVPDTVRDSWKTILNDEEVAFEKKLDRASYFLITDALAQLDTSEVEQWQHHHRQYYDWMRSVVAAADGNKLALGSRAWSKTSQGLRLRLIDEVMAAGGSNAYLVSVGQKLADIVSGKSQVEDIMSTNDPTGELFRQTPAAKRSLDHVRKVVELYASNNPGANVLEIGDGSVAASKVALAASQRTGLPGVSLFSHYDYTNSDSSSVESARKELVGWETIVDFKTLDIQSDPVQQSFKAGSYDLILASLSLQGVKEIASSLANVRALLKPGGQLILSVPTKSRLNTQLVLGSLSDSWHMHNESGKPSVANPLSEWKETLLTCGFANVQLEIQDCEEIQYQSLSVVMARNACAPSFPSSVSIVHAGKVPPQDWISGLQGSISKATGVIPVIEDLYQIDVKDKVCVVVAEMDSPLVDNMDADTFEKVRTLLLASRSVLWVTSGAISSGYKPQLAQIQGMLRTLKQEDSSVRRIHLDFEDKLGSWTSAQVRFLEQVFSQSFDFSVDDSTVECEYAVKDSLLQVPRVYHDLARDKTTSETQTDPEPVLKPWSQPDMALIWERDTSGLLSHTHFVDRPVVTQVPDGEVEVEARAFGLNFRDVLLALGQLDEGHTAHEACGIVSRLGNGTEDSGLQVGDRVCFLAPLFGSKVVTKWTNVARIPDSMSFEEGASIVASYVTGYLGLVDIAHLQKGETILIHAATGAAGQAAVMLAQYIGAEVYVTCGTPAKRDFLQRHYGLPADHIFNSRDASFAPAIMAATGGKGVDVVYNSLAGPLLKASWECLSRFGRFVEIGKMDMQSGRYLEMTPFLRMATYAGLDIIQVADYKPLQFNNALSTSLKWFDQGHVRAVAPITTYPISEMESAMRLMQSGGHMGKIVLVPHGEDQVKVISRVRPIQLDESSTYVIAGNVAGIGRSIALWMVERGAKDIVVVSRSAAKHPDMPALIHDAADQGCKLEGKNCDISSDVGVKQLARELAASGRRVGGVIVAAMVLDDTVMESLTYEQWQRGIKPKVSGSWNLHKHFQDVSFFTMLSSIVGVVGHASQASYAAGNAFQDALAKHRASIGLPAASLDLGAVSSVGYVAEAGSSIMNNVGKLGTIPIDMSHVLRIIEASVRGQALGESATAIEDSQYITAIAPYEIIPEEAVIRTDKRFGTLRFVDNGSAGGDVTVNSATLLKQSLAGGSLKKSEATPLIIAALADKLAETFSIEASDMDPSLAPAKYGLDSLIAVELRNWLTGTVKAKVSIFEILQSPSVNELGALVASKSEHVVQSRKEE